jgi:hypothetical protein
MYFPAFIIRLTLKNRYDISLSFLEEVLNFSPAQLSRFAKRIRSFST